MRDPIQEFTSFNRPFARRYQELLRLKIARMAESPFAFFRGTFHLYARDVLNSANPLVPLFSRPGQEMDLVGDIHSENFGTYRADDSEVHYDINDFDEATTGRFDFDAARLAPSHFRPARSPKLPLDQAVQIALDGLKTYTQVISRFVGKGRDANLDISQSKPAQCPLVDQLIKSGIGGKRSAFIAKIT